MQKTKQRAVLQTQDTKTWPHLSWGTPLHQLRAGWLAKQRFKPWMECAVDAEFQRFVVAAKQSRIAEQVNRVSLFEFSVNMQPSYCQFCIVRSTTCLLLWGIQVFQFLRTHVGHCLVLQHALLVCATPLAASSHPSNSWLELWPQL